MSEIKDLQRKEAVEKIKELAKDISVCMFCTRLEQLPFQTRPMSTQEVDDEGNIWFLSSKSSDKNMEIKQDDKVQLLYAKNTSAQFMSIFGRADIFYDREKIEKLWTPIAKAWFEKGKDDPDVSVICVRAQEGYYWDTKDGKMISLIKIAAGAITGNKPDEGIEGTMRT